MNTLIKTLTGLSPLGLILLYGALTNCSRARDDRSNPNSGKTTVENGSYEPEAPQKRISTEDFRENDLSAKTELTKMQVQLDKHNVFKELHRNNALDGKTMKELEGLVGKPYTVDREKVTYRFDAGLGGFMWILEMRNNTVYQVTVREIF